MVVRFRWIAAGSLAAMAMAAAAQGLIPGACQSPDMAAFPNDDDRHAAIRSYLLCLHEENVITQQVSGMLPRTSLGAFSVNPPAVRTAPEPRTRQPAPAADDHRR